MTKVKDAMQWLSVKDATSVAGVSRRTIYNWLNAGKLRTIRTAGGRLRIAPESLFRQEPASKGSR